MFPHPIEQELCRWQHDSPRAQLFIVVVCLLVIACGAPDIAPTDGVANVSPEVATPVESSPTAQVEPAATDDAYPDGFVLTMI